ncbi:MAG TPA: hypothetical protein VMH05_03775 [Bryobacteraceae bacterium]|nr:hypothetical protein [Bryobacteraceae bacterium]
MKQSWNLPIWIGFVIVVIALASYIPVFTPFAVTRDFPWANYLLFLVGGGVLAVGLRRAYREPQRYRGKVSGTILGALAVVLAGSFVVFTVYLSKQIPSADTALHIGQRAPAFTLQNVNGKPVTFADLANGHRAVLLIFYRGYW